jgi:hypothetical protein
MPDKDEDGFWDRLIKHWSGSLVVAGFFFGAALLCYWDFLIFAPGLGKTGGLLSCVIPGTLFALRGMWQLVSRK